MTSRSRSESSRALPRAWEPKIRIRSGRARLGDPMHGGGDLLGCHDPSSSSVHSVFDVVSDKKIDFLISELKCIRKAYINSVDDIF